MEYKYLLSSLVLAFIFWIPLDAKACCYVSNLTLPLSPPLNVLTSTGKTFKLSSSFPQELSESDYPVTISYFYDNPNNPFIMNCPNITPPTLTIETPGCDTISGGQPGGNGSCLPLKHVNWCPRGDNTKSKK